MGGSLIISGYNFYQVLIAMYVHRELNTNSFPLRTSPYVSRITFLFLSFLQTRTKNYRSLISMYFY